MVRIASAYPMALPSYTPGQLSQYACLAGGPSEAGPECVYNRVFAAKVYSATCMLLDLSNTRAEHHEASQNPFLQAFN